MQHDLPIFVYGTLKRGEVRERMWPFLPMEVRVATTRGALFDLGPYPALAQGEDLVLGELWFVREEHLDETLRVLDEIECYGQDDVDLYIRRVVECRDGDDEVHSAYTYFFADEAGLSRNRRVLPDEDGRCHWTAAHGDAV